ncbi:MAG TPA: hypothetical protein VF556_03385 [Pyrinomonadaceae bacterium]|jgi:CYTH domain-containing protein
MNAEATKYSRIEYERRFLVSSDSGWENFVEPYSKNLQDKYLKDSRLRLRTLIDSDIDRRLIKLTKKYESDSPYFQMITTMILSEAECHLLNTLKGYNLKKNRYYHNFQNQIFSIDVFDNELKGLILCETERDSLDELLSIEFPGYAKTEVTEDNFFRGGNLSRTTRPELLNKLGNL